MVGTIEPFYDETVSYVDNLRKAGVPVAFREFEGAWHGFEGIAMWTKIAKAANTWRDTQFFCFLSKYFAPQDESIPKDTETNRVCDVFPDTARPADDKREKISLAAVCAVSSCIAAAAVTKAVRKK